MKNLKVSLKLIISFLVVIALAVIVGAAGIIGMYQINAADDALYTYNLLAISQMGEIREELQRQRNYARDLGLNAGNEAKKQEFQQSLTKSDQYMKEFMAAYEETITDEALEANYFAAKKLYLETYADAKQRMINAGSIDMRAVADILYSQEVTDCLNTMVEAFTESMDNNNKWAKEQVDANTRLFTTMTIIEVSALALAVFTAMFFAVYVSSLMSKPLGFMSKALEQFGQQGDLELDPEAQRSAAACSAQKDEIGVCARAVGGLINHLMEVESVLSRIADGDLTAEIALLSDKDTIGLSLQKMVKNLNNMFSEINTATSQVSAGSKQIADGSQSLAQGSTQQAAAVEQLSSSISEIAQKTKDNADMADKAASLAGSIKGNAEKGSRQMDEMMTAVKEINQASQSINKVIKVIDDIAFQTNILALNAAVEAARAGQHGKGFAVVAEEVRNLAAKSAEAAKDTGSLIANSMEKAEHGARIADETAASLADIVSGINESSKLVGDIAKSSNEQAAGISQINKGIDQVAQVIQQNSATAEESSAASEEMSSQAHVLEGLVSQFRLKDSNGSRNLLSNAAGTHKTLSLPDRSQF